PRRQSRQCRVGGRDRCGPRRARLCYILARPCWRVTEVTMDDAIDPAAWELDERFAIGQPVPRSEDPVLLRGEGQYADDVSLPGQAYAVMVRSPYAHGVIRGIDAAAARAMPRVLAVY